MQPKYCILIILTLISMSTIYAEEIVFIPMETNIQLDINQCQIQITTEDDGANYITNITEPLCNTTAGSFSHHKEINVDFLRNFTTTSQDEEILENLTATCQGLLSEVKYAQNYTICLEGKTRIEETLAQKTSEALTTNGLLENKTTEYDQCDTKLKTTEDTLKNTQTDYSTCYNEKQTTETERDQYKQTRWTFAIVFALLGWFGHVLWIRKGYIPKESFPKQHKIIKQISPQLTKELNELDDDDI